MTPDLTLIINSKNADFINKVFYSGYYFSTPLFNNTKNSNVKKFFLKLIFNLFARPHKYIYNKKEIKNLIKSSLLNTKYSIKFYNKKRGKCPNTDVLDIHEKSIHLEVSFNKK